MIDNTQLEFDEESHTYKLNGTELTSVTTFIKEFFHKFDAPKKAEELAYSYGKYRNKSKGEILSMWREKGQIGTHVHKQIEDYILGDEPEELHDKAKQGIKFWESLQDKHDIQGVHPELKVYSEEYGLAGTIDLPFEHISGSGNLMNDVSIVDWKTNKAIYYEPYEDGQTGTHSITNSIPDANWHHYSLQLSLYAFILEQEYHRNIFKLYLCHVKQDEYEVYEIPYRREMIKKLCNVRKEQLKS